MSHFCCEQLGYVRHAPLGLSLNGNLWLCRQLQNRRMLAFTQACQQHDATIRKFQRIVMRRNLVSVDLPKDRALMRDYSIAPRDQAGRKASNLFSKRQLRPWKDADRYVRVFGSCEPSRARTKIVRGELIAIVDLHWQDLVTGRLHAKLRVQASHALSAPLKLHDVIVFSR